MNDIQLNETAVLYFANCALKDLREHADMIGFFTRCNGGSARKSWINITRRRVEDCRPVIRAAVKIFGSELFRRRGAQS